MSSQISSSYPVPLAVCKVSRRTAQAEAENLRSQVEKLQHENQMLRMRLGEDASRQEPITPRMSQCILLSACIAVL